MAEVTLTAVSKVYDGGVRAVDAVDLVVPDTSFTVLVGPSGCGKSTLLRMIAGIEEISSGELRIDGRIVNDVAPRDRDIAMVFQNYALYPHMTVYENMAFSLRLRKAPTAEIEARVREAAAMLGLEQLLERKPKALSGGQRQRVAVGRAIVRKPKVFLFDEPLSNLDAKMRVQTRAELVRLHKRLEATMIYVTHDQAEAMTMGDRIVAMRDGRVQQIAAPMDIYTNPANAFVAGFIGSPPMNFVLGRVESTADGLALVCADAGFTVPVHALPEGTRGALVEGRRALLGIRPENIRTVPAPDGSASVPFTATVELVEPMGAEQYASLRTGTATLVARLDPEEVVSVDAKQAFSLHLAKARLFDPETDAALVAP